MKIVDIKNCNVYLESKKALSNFSLAIDEFEHVAIVGPNGSGKSTLIRLLVRDVFPCQGDQENPQVEILSSDNWSILELRHKIALISPQFTESLLLASPLTIFDAVASSFCGTYGFFADDKIAKSQIAVTEEVLQKLHLAKIKNQFIHELSTGQLRKVLIARAMVLSPQIILLDEPTSGLDIAAQYEFMKFIKQITSDCTIILVTHHLEEILPEIKKVLLIKNGQVFKFGKKAEVLTGKNLSELFDVEVQVKIASDQTFSMSRI